MYNKKILVNLPVRDLDETQKFFSKIGFKVDHLFTGENVLCMKAYENIYVIFLMEEYFKNLTKKKISDAKKSTEVIVALAVENRGIVDEMVDAAFKAGGIVSTMPDDQGFMYSRSFQDINGHLWEIMYIDPDVTGDE